MSCTAALDTEHSAQLRWHVDSERKLISIVVGPEVSDYELEYEVPRIWQEHPDCIWFDVLVDHRRGSGMGNWTWHGLQTAAKNWNEYVGDRKPDKSVALLTNDFWITQIVNNLLAHIFRGCRYRCFQDNDSAMKWIAESRSAP